MRAPVRAFVAHCTPTRIRIKLMEPVKMRGRLSELKQLFCNCPGVVAVQLNPLTGSLIIECQKHFELTAEHRRLLRLDPQGQKSGRSIRQLRARIAPIADQEIARTLIFAHALKFIVGLSTNKIGALFGEWTTDAIIRAAEGEVQRRGAERKLLLARGN
jgi:hypothetical protein